MKLVKPAIFSVLLLIGCASNEVLTGPHTMLVKEKCPVGGERFSSERVFDSITFFQLPDGQRVGAPGGALSVVCPKNGLVVYRDFSAKERDRLPAILASPDYIVARNKDTPSYRAAIIERYLNPSNAAEIAGLLLRATWESSGHQKAQYQAEFAEVAAGLKMTDLSGLVLKARAANALRELERFDESRSRIEQVDEALKALPSETPPPFDESEKENLATYVAKLKVVILRKDSDAKPIDMLPDDMAAYACYNNLGVAGWDPHKLCADPRYLPLIDEMEEQAKLHPDNEMYRRHPLLGEARIH